MWEFADLLKSILSDLPQDPSSGPTQASPFSLFERKQLNWKKIKSFLISILLLSKEKFSLFFSFFLYLLLIFFAHFSEIGHVHVVLLGLGLM